MNRTQTSITAAAFLGTFAWFLAPDLKGSPGVLWPSVLAVGLAFVTRDIYLSLFLGAFSGALLLHGGNPWLAFHDLFIGRLIPSLSDRWNLGVLVFTLLMGGFVEVLNRNGGMSALSAKVMGRSRSPRRAGLGAYFMGWLVFFDGLASSMLVGKTLRPIADRAGLSREKLAFIVDSTSAPVAGLALLSTWVAYEMSVIREGFSNTGEAALADAVAPFSWLVMSLPYRFYNWFMLLLVFLLVWLMRDWGPMLAAERASRARLQREFVGTTEATALGLALTPALSPAEGERVAEGRVRGSFTVEGDPAKAEAGEGVSSRFMVTGHDRQTNGMSRAALALVPLGALILGVFGGLYVGGGGLEHEPTLSNLVQAMGKADAANVFVLATAFATVVALGMTAASRAVSHSVGTPEGGTQAFLHGMQQMFLPALILVFAWMLNSVIKELGAAQFLVARLGERLPAAWLPALVFLLASTVSFSTGTSWGTMAIVMPLAIPLAVRLTAFHAGMPAGPVLVGTVGAVLAGAVFGDHCSPISDTTIVSAFSSDCEVMAHVRTQMPYALAAALLAVVFGYLPAGYGVSPVVLLAVGGLACWLLVRYRGHRVEAADAG